MITIDTVIELCENQILFSNEEYMKLAEWLEELKRRREHDGEIIGSGALNNAYNQGYNKAIDDFEKEMIRSYLTEREKEYIRYKAEQLKEGGTDE